MRTNPNRFWIVVIVLGWIFDFLFWNKPLGVNFAIFAALCLLTAILLLRADGLRFAQGSGWLLPPVAFFAAITFIRLEPMTVFLSVAMTLFLMGVIAVSYLNGGWIRYSLTDYVLQYLGLFVSMIGRPIGFAAQSQRSSSGQSSPSDKRNVPVWPIARGVVIALPVIAIFASLLSSADPIFAKRLGDFIGIFKINNLPEYIFRLVLILVVAYVLAGAFLHAAQKSGEGVDNKTWISPFLGFTESSIVLGSVVILFISFVIIQFQYFFGGQVNISIEGYTYAEYARKGFGELVAVAFFSLLLLLGLGAITRRETENQRRTFSLLGVGLVGLVIVMLMAAFQRLVLYEMAYGFSRLRTYTHVFMIWLGLLLLAVVILEVLRHEHRVALALVFAALGFGISLNLLNVDAFIVKQNIQREILSTTDKAFAQGRADLDAQYFVGLSDDAVPPLANAFHAKALPTSVREQVGAALVCKQYEHKQATSTYPWQSFHFSRFYAGAAFKQLNKELNSYKIVDKDLPPKVQTPSGQEFPCYQDYYD